MSTTSTSELVGNADMVIKLVIHVQEEKKSCKTRTIVAPTLYKCIWQCTCRNSPRHQLHQIRTITETSL
jgi:hypothetical protein